VKAEAAIYAPRKSLAYRWECMDCDANDTCLDINVAKSVSHEHAREEAHEVLLLRIIGDIQPLYIHD
jgi:hypothetical protein